MSNYEFFWNGIYSQWHISPFIINGQKFNTCEQWMMWNKAKLFGDEDIAQQILDDPFPNNQKALGRKVKNFDDAKWMEVAYDIVVQGNRAKFSQDQKLSKQLKETVGKELVEASPYDKRWGIGMRAGDAGIENPANWKGDNLLGKAITQVRIEMFGE